MALEYALCMIPYIMHIEIFFFLILLLYRKRQVNIERYIMSENNFRPIFFLGAFVI